MYGNGDASDEPLPPRVHQLSVALFPPHPNVPNFFTISMFSKRQKPNGSNSNLRRQTSEEAGARWTVGGRGGRGDEQGASGGQAGAAGTNLAISKSVTSCIPILMKPHCIQVSCETRKWHSESTNLHVGANVIAPRTLMSIVAIASATFHPTAARDSSSNIA